MLLRVVVLICGWCVLLLPTLGSAVEAVPEATVLEVTMEAEAKPSVSIALGEWPPFIGSKLSGFGAISRIVTSAFESQGYQVVVGFFPWKRSFELTRLGEWDATAVWVRNPERERAFVFSDTVMVASEVFFYRKDSQFSWKSLDDLENYVIGGSTGYYHGATIEQGEKTGVFSLERIPDEAANFKKLLMGRVDLVVANKDVGYYLMNQIFDSDQLAKITHHRKPVETATYHLILGKNNSRSSLLVSTFNKGLATILKR